MPPRDFGRQWDKAGPDDLANKLSRDAAEAAPTPVAPTTPLCPKGTDYLGRECRGRTCPSARAASQERPSIDVDRLAFALHEHFSEPEGQTCWHDQDAERVVRIYENAREYGFLSEQPPTRSDE